ncbi:hypothetical protein [Holospora curviuscula]|uniref:Tc1-like transposase DDE domain-containing protein n=1 Tax=Holospora curviuscula TaxID=1082868 RepID=A0A2S5R8X8_9PROT|nr:hypothetical protein [Holospora curviuscula]PPE03757.1 hypothetical protein HCUR_00772 [Holospora curviuscula]
MGSTLGEIRLRTGSVEVLTYWVEEMLCTNTPENCGTILDNAVFHKGKAIQKIIKDASHTLPITLFS